MLPAILATVATVLSAVAVALITYYGGRLPSLESQRADFNSVVQPLREEVRDLRDRVATLEAALDGQERKYRIAVRYISALLGLASPPVPPVPPEIYGDL
ncbi:hypothetical protein [Nocardia puris]|uniref:Uncharacterized protein n=1 Tax=Nocardia puris TaxID=208602 RepID=A0A366DD36_9NOCA|nr:hypothetical protein [Nocardia puris]RBO87953.1 hypothetical protein DFR74_110209 [Nocardia puris]